MPVRLFPREQRRSPAATILPRAIGSLAAARNRHGSRNGSQVRRRVIAIRSPVKEGVMRKAATSVLMAVGLAAGLCLAPAHAQLARPFVSAANGDDANNCDRPTPCRTFQAAHDKTFDQGEVTVLDPGGYGAVRITKSISIVNNGVGQAGMLVSGGGAGITIDAPA